VFLPNGAANAARIAAQPGGHVRRFASAANNAFGAHDRHPEPWSDEWAASVSQRLSDL
jgi:hypothetical protein